MADVKWGGNAKFLYSGLVLLLFYIVFLQPETVFEEQYNGGQPFSVEIKTYGTGFFNREISVIHYKIDGKTVESDNFTFFSPFTRSIHAMWKVDPAEGSWWIDNTVNVSMEYWAARGLHHGEYKSIAAGYDFDWADD